MCELQQTPLTTVLNWHTLLVVTALGFDFTALVPTGATLRYAQFAVPRVFSILYSTGMNL